MRVSFDRRYSNILPFDHHRVALRSIPRGRTDYVNATRVTLPGLAPSRVIIAAQAPLHPDFHGPDTCGDFWRAVTENGVGTIVALARVQKGFSGSAQYFPTAASPVVTHGEFTISLVEERMLSEDIALRTLDVATAGTWNLPERFPC